MSPASTPPEGTPSGTAPARALGVVVTHGAMSQGLVDAVRKITGVEEEALVAVSNDGKGPDALVQEVAAAAARADGPVVIFTDLQVGSCALAARFVCRDPTNRTVLFGTNLPMLLDFVFHRELPIEVLQERLLERGRAGIRALSDDSREG
jgi:mannose/fructose-specific phosphotransferase system component IIA